MLNSRRPNSLLSFSFGVNLLLTCGAIYCSFRLIKINQPPLTASAAVCKRINSAERMINTSSLKRCDLCVSGGKKSLHSGAQRRFIGGKDMWRWQQRLLVPLFLEIFLDHRDACVVFSSKVLADFLPRTDNNSTGNYVRHMSNVTTRKAGRLIHSVCLSLCCWNGWIRTPAMARESLSAAD